MRCETPQQRCAAPAGRACCRIASAAPILQVKVTFTVGEEDLITMASIQRVAEAILPTCYGTFRMLVYGAPDGKEHVALIVGSHDSQSLEPVLVRLHSECMTGDVFGSSRCDCGEQLAHSLDLLQREGQGILLYMRQEGRGIGLTNKIRAYALQDRGYDTVEANLALGLPEDMRDYAVAAAMLIDLRVRQVRLLTNNPAKVTGLARHGIAVVERLPLPVQPTPHNRDYLRTKRDKMGHLLALPLVMDEVQAMSMPAARD